jgi:hypothetical protein
VIKRPGQRIRADRNVRLFRLGAGQAVQLNQKLPRVRGDKRPQRPVPGEIPRPCVSLPDAAARGQRLPGQQEPELGGLEVYRRPVTHHARQAIALNSDRGGLQRADGGASLPFRPDVDRLPEGTD